MFNVIICDDNEKDLENIVKATKKFMNENEYEYSIHKYTDYNNSFEKIIESKIPFKIYLLDIETPSRSGVDVARQIRKKDVDSIIMFLTAHEELGSVVLKNDLMFLSFINKFDNMNDRLNKSLKKAIQMLHHKNIIKIIDKNISYTINLNDILYVTKDSFERKTIIKTDYSEIKVSKSMNDVIQMLDKRFIQTHRACYINEDRRIAIDRTNKIIIFDNGEKINLLSDKYKKEVC